MHHFLLALFCFWCLHCHWQTQHGITLYIINNSWSDEKERLQSTLNLQLGWFWIDNDNRRAMATHMNSYIVVFCCQHACFTVDERKRWNLLYILEKVFFNNVVCISTKKVLFVQLSSNHEGRVWWIIWRIGVWIF